MVVVVEIHGVLSMRNKKPRTDPKSVSNAIRLWSRAGPFDPRNRDQCCIWQGHTTAGGYGMFTLQNGKKAYAHVFSYEFANDVKVPKGRVVRHVCPGVNGPQRNCIRPDHLVCGTYKENAQDTLDDLNSSRTKKLEKISNQDAKAIRHLYKTERFSQGSISEFFFGTRKFQPVIQRIVSGLTYRKAGGPLLRKGRGKVPARRNEKK